MTFLDCKKLYSQGTMIYEILIVMIICLHLADSMKWRTGLDIPKPMSTVKQLSVL